MANRFVVSIVVGLKDQASAGLKGLSGSIQNSAESLRQTGAGMAAAGTAVTAGFLAAAREAGTFQDKLVDVRIQSGATVDEMARIRESAFDQDFVRLGLSADEVAEAYKRLAAEGLGVVAMQEMLKPIMETSVALGTDQADTTKLMLNLMEQYRLEADKAGYVSDVLAGALAATSFQGEELAETMKYAGMAGSALGWSLEETIGVVDRIIKVTGEASMAGTYFRGVINALRDPTKKMVDELTAVGITMDEVAEAIKTPAGLIELLTRAEKQGANMTAMFSARAGAAAEALIGQAASTQEVIDSIYRQGAASEAAAAKAAEGSGPWKALVAELKNFVIELGGPVTDVLREILPDIKGLVAWLADLVKTDLGKGAVKWAFGLGVLLQVTGPLLYALPTIASGLGKIAGGLKLLPGVASAAASGMAGLGPALLAAGPYIALAIAIAGLAYELWELSKAYKTAADAGREMVENLEAQLAFEAEAVAKGYGTQAELARQQAAVAAARPTIGEWVTGAIAPGGVTGWELARGRVSQAQPSVAYRPSAQGPGVAPPEQVTNVNVYIGDEKLREDQRRVATGVVREAMAGAR